MRARYISNRELTFPYLKNLIEQLWDGDVTLEEIVDTYPIRDVNAMEDTLYNNPTVYKEGVPFPGDDPIYDGLLNTDKGAQLIQRMIEDWE